MTHRLDDGRTVGIAHDYLTQRGGAERVVLALARAFPGAPVHTTLYDPPGTYPEFAELDVRVSPLNRVGPLRRSHRAALPVLHLASEALTPTEDVVIASTSGWAHGFHACGDVVAYCHSPARWLYQSQEYLGGPLWTSARGVGLGAVRPMLRRWDARAARRPTRYLANSRIVRQRIADAYGIDATVVPAPHSMDASARQAPVPELEDWAEAGIPPRGLPPAPVQERARAAGRRAGHRPPPRRRGQRSGPRPHPRRPHRPRPAGLRPHGRADALGLRTRHAAPRPEPGGLRPDADRGGGLRGPQRHPPGRRLPRHRRRGGHRPARRPAGAGALPPRDRGGAGPPVGPRRHPRPRRHLLGGAVRRRASAPSSTSCEPRPDGLRAGRPGPTPRSPIGPDLREPADGTGSGGTYWVAGPPRDHDDITGTAGVTE